MDKTLAKELELVEAVKAHLEDGKMARTFEVPDDEDAQLWFKGYISLQQSLPSTQQTYQRTTSQMTAQAIRMLQR